ncbi:MAG: hypothetical protein ABJG47_08030 [Ekhidna sp.]
MISNRSILGTGFLLISFFLFGQPQHSFSNIEKHIGEYSNYKKPHLLAFDFSDEDPSYREMPFKIIQIVDSTETNQIYGFVYKGYQNTKRPIKFKNGMEFQFQKFVNNYSFHNPLGKSIVMVVTDFWIDKKKELSKKFGVISMKINYYESGRLIFSDIQVESLQKSSTKLKFHVALISKMLSSSMERLSAEITSQ